MGSTLAGFAGLYGLAGVRWQRLGEYKISVSSPLASVEVLVGFLARGELSGQVS